MEELSGSQCVPALWFDKPLGCSEEIGKDEVLPTEGLHTVAGHMKIYTKRFNITYPLMSARPSSGLPLHLLPQRKQNGDVITG